MISAQCKYAIHFVIFFVSVFHMYYNNEYNRALHCHSIVRLLFGDKQTSKPPEKAHSLWHALLNGLTHKGHFHGPNGNLVFKVSHNSISQLYGSMIIRFHNFIAGNFIQASTLLKLETRKGPHFKLGGSQSGGRALDCELMGQELNPAVVQDTLGLMPDTCFIL